MFLHWKQRNRRRQGFTLGEVLVSFAVFTVVVAGLIYGYAQINRMAALSSMSLAAQSFCEQGLEQAKSVQWNYVRWPNTNADSYDPFWVPAAQGGVALPPEVDTMDIPTSGQPIYVTNYVTVSNICTYLNPMNPPLRQISCTCVWAYPLYPGSNAPTILCTNFAFCVRAPDQ